MWQDESDFTSRFGFVSSPKKTSIKQHIIHFQKALTPAAKNIKAPETGRRAGSLAEQHVIADMKVSGDLIPYWVATSFHLKSDGGFYEKIHTEICRRLRQEDTSPG